MSDPIRHVLEDHLYALKLAGVQWLPKSDEPLSLPAFEESAQAEPSEQYDPEAQRRQELQLLKEEVSKCERCPHLASTRTQTVFGTGPLSPELCFVGEAPGADEDAQGEPFVGAAGQLLTRIINAMGMKREEVYILNTIKCRPPGNRTPRLDEADNCREFLERQIDLIDPAYICTLGGTAAKYLLDVNLSVGKLRGRTLDYNGIPVVCTYHPAYLLGHRNKNEQEVLAKKRLVWEDVQFLLAQMGRPVPQRNG